MFLVSIQMSLTIENGLMSKSNSKANKSDLAETHSSGISMSMAKKAKAPYLIFFSFNQNQI